VLLAAANGIVPFLSDTYEGSRHDKPIADQTAYPLPEGSELLQDLGFVGFTLAGVLITQPHKKPRGKELTAEQKAENRVIARRRVFIEHIICSIKRCRIVKDTIRLWKDTARDMVMAVCCGLHNFRLRLCPWPSLAN
jgi:Zn ribbon nucleic-acid-binding protein